MKNGAGNKCLECGKKGTMCRGLCQACYSRYYRSTPEGKRQLELYRETKGKEATARYLAKRPPSPPKEIKICECGAFATVKGFCFKCYQKYYQRRKHGSVPRKQRIKKSIKSIAGNNILDLSIYKDDKNLGQIFNKQPRGWNVSEAKQIALKDISKECGTGIYTRNYLNLESSVLNACKCIIPIIHL